MRSFAAGLGLAACVGLLMPIWNVALAQTPGDLPSPAIVDRPLSEPGTTPEPDRPAADSERPRAGPELTLGRSIAIGAAFMGLCVLMILVIWRAYLIEKENAALRNEADHTKRLQDVNDESADLTSQANRVVEVGRLKEQLSQMIDSNRTLMLERDRIARTSQSNETEIRKLLDRVRQFNEELGHTRSENEQTRRQLEKATSEIANLAAQKKQLLSSLETAEREKNAAIAHAEAEIAKIEAMLTPDYLSGPGKDLYDELRRDARSGVAPAAAAAAYLFVLRSFPLTAGRQHLPPAFLDAVAEFGRQLISYRRSQGDNEEAIATRLNAWARIINKNDQSGIAINVPIVGGRIDPSWMTYASGSEVKTTRSWCVRDKGIVARKAEVNFS